MNKLSHCIAKKNQNIRPHTFLDAFGEVADAFRGECAVGEQS